jgi:hypothetical protein
MSYAFSALRKGSIGFDQFVLIDCFENGCRRFSVTADHHAGAWIWHPQNTD